MLFAATPPFFRHIIFAAARLPPRRYFRHLRRLLPSFILLAPGFDRPAPSASFRFISSPDFLPFCRRSFALLLLPAIAQLIRRHFIDAIAITP